MPAHTIGAVGSSRYEPQSVEQITKAAQEYDFDASVSFKRYIRTANALIQQARIYMQEGDDEMVYLLLFRHAHLILVHLATHPEYKRGSVEAKELEKLVSQNLGTLDLLKPRINRRYEEHQAVVRRRQAQKQQESSDRLYALQLESSQNTDLAAELAQQEFANRSEARQAYPTAFNQSDNENLAQELQSVRRQLDRPQERKDDKSGVTRAQTYSYPTVQQRQREPAAAVELPDHNRREARTGPSVAPARPPKPAHLSAPRPPVIPQKLPAVASKASAEPEQTYTFAPGGVLESGKPLRTVFLPKTLRTTFLRLAYNSTKANRETCAFLCGTLRANAFFISALVLPNQVATSDTCEMTDESQLFDYVDEHGLMVLGWIHTHPTQTCFMSSADLHTHAGWQMLIAESIAIVCAPSKGDTSMGGDWAAFRLTDPPGKMHVLQCTKSGIFHPHDIREDDLYKRALPGHVMEIGEMDFEIVDLRN